MFSNTLHVLKGGVSVTFFVWSCNYSKFFTAFMFVSGFRRLVIDIVHHLHLHTEQMDKKRVKLFHHLCWLIPSICYGSFIGYILPVSCPEIGSRTLHQPHFNSLCKFSLHTHARANVCALFVIPTPPLHNLRNQVTSPVFVWQPISTIHPCIIKNN